MSKIFKYELKVVDEQDLILPDGFKILSVQNQGERITLWALVDDSAVCPKSHVTFHIFGTGHLILDYIADNYVSTVQMGNGLVWHVFTHYQQLR